MLFLSSERTIKRKRQAVVDRASSNETNIQPFELKSAFDYFHSAKVTEGLRERSLSDYANTWRYFTDWIQENDYEITYIHEITKEICRKYFHYQATEAPRFKGHIYIQGDRGKGLSPTTINMRIRALKVAFNFWVREGFLSQSPMDNIRTQKTDEDKIESFTDDQIDLLLNACDQRTYVGFRDYVMQVTLLDSMMRVNELLSLRPQDVDLKTRCIELSAKFNKNRRSRIIPLSTQTVKLLFELIQENKNHFPHAEKVFLSCYGEELRDTQVNKRLKYYGDVTGVGKEIRTSAHTYRHTGARTYILNGGDPFTLQRLLGHSSLQMVRRYIQMTDIDVKAQHDKFSPVNRLRTKTHWR